MKKAILTCALVLGSLTGYASEGKLIKSCNAVMPSEVVSPMAQNASMNINIYDQEGSLLAINTNSLNGSTVVEKYKVEISDDTVRALSAESLEDDSLDLNLSERLIAHAIALSSLDAGDGRKPFSTGIDLTKVRSAKVYKVGEETRMGMVAVVEARDENGNDLGSFLGGFLVLPCK